MQAAPASQPNIHPIEHVTRSAVFKRLAWNVLTALALLLSACTAKAPAAATPDLAATQTFAQALSIARQERMTATPSPLPPTETLTPSPTATLTLTPTPTAIRTPPPLPAVFVSDVLDKSALPQTYIQNTCQYLKARWSPSNSVPGTVVMIIMYHSVTDDSKPLLPDGSQVHHSDLIRTLDHAHELGFETITTAQLVDFLKNNSRIPPRSLLIIVDDRKRKAFYETHFIPSLKQYHWTITNAWISATDTPDLYWQENEEIVAAGWLDVQAHGVVHNIPIGAGSSDDYILNELNGSIAAIEKHYGKPPIGFIWPGGGFSQHAVELARQVGYQVGFTTNPRGPVMYNWIPQANEEDKNHPNWLPEIPEGDPLMTLPRYWSSDALYRLDDVVKVGEQAKAQAEQDRPTELEYYDIVCKNSTGEIPTP